MEKKAKKSFRMDSFKCLLRQNRLSETGKNKVKGWVSNAHRHREDLSQVLLVVYASQTCQINI